MGTLKAWLKKFGGWIAAGAAFLGALLLGILTLGSRKPPAEQKTHSVDPVTDDHVRQTEVKAAGDHQAANEVADIKVGALNEVAKVNDEAKRLQGIADMANKS